MIDAATLLDIEAAFRHLADVCSRLDEGPAGETCKAAARKLEAARMQADAKAKADEPGEPEMLAIADAAARFNVSRSYLQRLCRDAEARDESKGFCARGDGWRWRINPVALRNRLRR